MSDTTFEVHDPATGLVIENIADGTVEDATRAVDAAAAAFPAWAATPTRARAEILRRCYDLMIRDADLLTGLIAAENGKSVADARAEVTYAAEFFRWFSEEAVRGEGTYSDAPNGGARTLVTHAPVGVAALVTPWNFPAAMATRKIAPALAAGCTVVLKPAAETPLTALAVARILLEAGVPEGVVNVVPTTDAASVVTAWLEDPRVRKVSFTGSTGVGRTLLRQAADRVLNTSMELGGNAPFVITADADIDAAVAGAMIAKFRGGGQACTAANRFYVHADVAAEFVEKFGAAVAALKVGPSADASNQIGPVISEKALTGITKLVDAAVADGARVAVQGAVPEAGWFFPPTILVDVPFGAPILSEEIFGPVAPIVTWTDEAEMIASVNDTEFGLAAYVYAGRLQDALRLGEQVEAGMVGINRGIVSDPSAPFGGVKQSGIGREGAHEGIREYQETRYYSVDWS
ncbi:NAD-dependent succinate-semialdehyde dehydrogenase [Pimelobacter simplex]|uniref:NAD-dependent succinate-semialdehyde dehydrogenase n=1 Tax=Nocardioides simplex TaxID=2045 RepID=UPI0021504D0E|nr:NAD-dependent succinate-semialdehyde dehydrogenase [Pimelobacter simplex]UUW87697.1 NAD-dependent succinate-semialdehyde dehydrogenase [Pimelobacter simplex]UUW97203.1 NAD-dependent succinate-semialdehyde dehydrogenase [Pimelobacter simplex]